LKDIGLQLWTVRNQLAESKARTLAAVKKAGYSQVELMSTIVEAGRKFGLKYLVFGYAAKGHRESAEQFQRMAARANIMGRKRQAAGIQFCYHNHSFEYAKLPDSDQTGFDIFIDAFDHDLVKFELDVFWTDVGGWDAVKTIERLGSRVAQLHLKDKLSGTPTIFDEGAMPDEAFQALGDGTIDMAAVVRAGKKACVAQCHVEQDQSPDPIASIGRSINYLHALEA
jgi:sugar phosphate isomerase/epimerase